jgi:hypothetical protein
MEFADAVPLLRAIEIAQASKRELEVRDVAAELGLSTRTLRKRIAQLEDMGLILAGLKNAQPPRLLRAGHQYMAVDGAVSDSVLGFLPRTIDDLHARRALLHGGTILVDEFRGAILQGRAVGHARMLVPDAFIPRVTAEIAIDLFAACVALTTRLSEERPPGCIAEEIMAVTLLDDARAWLDLEVAEGQLDDVDAHVAARRYLASSRSCGTTTCSAWLG